MQTKINLLIPVEMYEALRKEAYEKRVPMSSIVREAIKNRGQNDKS